MIEIAQRINELLQAQLPQGSIVKFYDEVPAGTDGLIMPAIATEIRAFDINWGPTGMDKLTVTGHTVLYVNKNFDGGNQHSDGSPASANFIDRILFGLDFSGTYAQYTTNSIIGILRTHPFLMGDTVNTSSTEVFYSNTLSCSRIDGPQDKTYIFEVVFSGIMNVQVLSRQ